MHDHLRNIRDTTESRNGHELMLGVFLADNLPPIERHTPLKADDAFVENA